MSQNQTGKSLIQLFETCCNESHKLFIPDSPRQDDIANSLVRHYEWTLLERAVRWYVENNSGPFLVFDFAIQSRDVVEKVKYETESKTKFQDIVAETRKRMESS